MKNIIDSELDPRKNNFLDQSKDNLCELNDIPTILKNLGITKTEYYGALSVSSDSDIQIHIK